MSAEGLYIEAERLLDNAREHKGDYLAEIEFFMHDLIERVS